MTGCIVLNGDRGTVGETGEDTGVVHILVAGDVGDGMTKVLKVADSGSQKVECSEVAICFGAKSACWFCPRVTRDEDGEGGVGLDTAGVGCGETSYGTIRAKVEVACLNSMEKIVDIAWRLR